MALSPFFLCYSTELITPNPLVFSFPWGWELGWSSPEGWNFLENQPRDVWNTLPGDNPTRSDRHLLGFPMELFTPGRLLPWELPSKASRAGQGLGLGSRAQGGVRAPRTQQQSIGCPRGGRASQAMAPGELRGFQRSLLAKWEACRAKLRGPSEKKLLDGIEELRSLRDDPLE